ncbi:MAG TPA: carbohydrate-binding protein [Acidobacteriota bacterium]|nr:carbohydrate-binding protein [Acidobacteriota bacterium]
MNISGQTGPWLYLPNVQSANAGTYSVVVTNASGSATSTGATLTVGGSGSLGVDLQAEDAVLFGALARTNQTGYTGTGFVDYINASGDYIEWTATMPSSGSRTLTFRYASTGSPRLLEIKVNGTVVNTGLAFPNTGGANIWTTLSTTATLPAGTVTIRATATGTSGPNMDYLRID